MIFDQARFIDPMSGAWGYLVRYEETASSLSESDGASGRISEAFDGSFSLPAERSGPNSDDPTRGVTSSNKASLGRAEDAEVLGMWAKATRTARTALVKALDEDRNARFTLLYQAALQAATAVVRAAGFRVRCDHNHQITFAAAAALGSGDLSEAARDLNVVRQGRHAAVYDWQATTDGAQLVELRAGTALLLLLREAYSWLLAQRPSLTGKLVDPPGSPQ
ncbi:MAG: hypothetical protein GEU90_11955 [Gemmatimonas sp.]|nr:hypothetical protein [Gemmatimonas sp.]